MTPALHTPLMAVTNAVSGIIIVGAIIAVGAVVGKGVDKIVSPGIELGVRREDISFLLGLIAIVLASVNIFGGFIVTRRMLAMFRKKEGKR